LQKQTPCRLSASELYRPSDRSFFGEVSANFADSGCCVITTTDPYGRIFDFLDRRHSLSLNETKIIIISLKIAQRFVHTQAIVQLVLIVTL
jgi:hypothetical protein